MNSVEVEAVSKRFDGFVAVNGLSFSVRRGSIFGLLGPNGAGKTTTIRMIVGIFGPDSGEIKVLGEPVTPELQQRIGYMPEERGLYKKMKVGEQLLFFAQLKGVQSSEANRRIDQWLARMELSDWKQKKSSELSKGMQQKVQFIATVLHEPELLILDEPFSGLDARLRDDVRGATFSRLKQEEAAVLMVTHDPDEAMRVGDQIAVMGEGRILQTGTPTEIYLTPRDPQAAALFGGANVFHARVLNGSAYSPFGQSKAVSLAEGSWAEILYRPTSIRVAGHGIPAKVLAVRPYAGQLEVEAALESLSLPEGVEVPTFVRAAAPMEAAIVPGAEVRLFARPEDAFVFPCRDKVCRS